MEEFKDIPIEQLRQSPTNPRRRRDPKKFQDLCASVKEKGIIQPIVAREGIRGNVNDSSYEIVVGEGRYLAAKKVGLEKIPAMVRELSDLDVIEIQLIENKQREDMNCLEEAEGYQRLAKDGGYSIQRIAERIGLSEKYVYDRIKLLQLIPEAKKLVLTDRITAGHAILLARLKLEDQKRAIDPEGGGLFEGEDLLFNPHATDEEFKKLSKEEQKYFELKPRSVRELEGWIDEHVRFDRNAPIVVDLFPATAAAVKSAVEEKEKVIQITHEHYVQPDAKEGNTERIFSDVTWKLADGSSKDAKTCEKSVTGVVVVGPERGAAHKVCVNKDCPVHWGKEKREREKRAKMPSGAAAAREEKDRERRLAEQLRKEARRQAFDKAKPALIRACIEKIRSAKFGAIAQLAYHFHPRLKDKSPLPKAKTADDLSRALLVSQLIDQCNSWWESEFVKGSGLIGVDVEKIIAAETPQTSAKKGRAAA